MKSFNQLTRRGQLRRLRKLAEDSLQEYGLQESRITFLRHFANTTYRVDFPHTPSQNMSGDPYRLDRYLLRVLASTNWDFAKGEMTWLAALSKEAGLPVPAPVLNREGELMTRVITSGIPGGRIVSLMRWVDGRKKALALKPHHFEAWGEAVGKMHSFASTWHPPDGFERYTWDWEGLLGGKYFREKVEDLVTTLPRSIQNPFLKISKETHIVMDSLGRKPDAYGVIHGDMYADNLIFKGDRVFIIDFEDCGFGYWLWDIALALGSNPWTDSWYRDRDAFLNGYLKYHSLSDTHLKHLDTFIAADAATGAIWAAQFLLDEPGRREEHEIWRDECGRRMSHYITRR